MVVGQNSRLAKVAGDKPGHGFYLATALYRECNHGAHIMHGLRKLIQSLSDLPDEQPIEPDLKTTKNKERDREIK